jgi:hypothetical protein
MKRQTSHLSDSLQRKLNAYALAASAAGVGVLALPQTTEAKIVYTKTDVNVFHLGLPLDLTNDGTADFVFFPSEFQDSCLWSTYLRIFGSAYQSNAVWWEVGGAAALRAGVLVGPKGHFLEHRDFLMGRVVLNTCGTGRNYYAGHWENGGKGVTNRYLGLRFKIKGKEHYGWARLNFPRPRGATLTGYAYETISGKPIITGKTHGKDEATLGRLAQGASNVSNGGKP